MAISTEQVTAAVNASFENVEDFVSMLKLLAGVGARVKLEVQRDAAQREIGALHAQQQTISQSKQTELEQAIAELNQAIATKQQEAAALQAQIDVLNAQLPDLLG